MQFNHVGIYVKDLDKMTNFYKQCFAMDIQVENFVAHNDLLDSLLEVSGSKLLVTKLVKDDFMIELVQVTYGKQDNAICNKLTDISAIHLCFTVEDIDSVIVNVENCGGSKVTEVLEKPDGSKMCFCKDVEGNFLELIENK